MNLTRRLEQGREILAMTKWCSERRSKAWVPLHREKHLQNFVNGRGTPPSQTILTVTKRTNERQLWSSYSTIIVRR